MSKSERKRMSRKKKSRRKVTSKDQAIYNALKNPEQTTSVIDGNGIKRWLNPYGFISALHRSIKMHKKFLTIEEAHNMITKDEMPAIQRCLRIVLMLNYSKDFDERDLHIYIARKFEHITLEMLSKDYQTEEASEFKEVLVEIRRLQSE